MPTDPKKHPRQTFKPWRDLLLVLELTLEASVVFLWAIMEALVGGLRRLLKIPRRWFKRTAN